MNNENKTQNSIRPDYSVKYEILVLINKVSQFQHFAIGKSHNVTGCHNYSQNLSHLVNLQFWHKWLYSLNKLGNKPNQTMFPERKLCCIATRSASALNGFREFLYSRLNICHDGYKSKISTGYFNLFHSIVFSKHLTLCSTYWSTKHTLFNF